MSPIRRKPKYTGVITRKGKAFVSICLELDVASQGRTQREAREALFEAVSLYLETALEENIPSYRPVPAGENPLNNPKSEVVSRFSFEVTGRPA